MNGPGIIAVWHIALVITLAGVVVAYVGLFADREYGRRRCPTCWYSLFGISGRRCPECGYEAESERSLHRARRSWIAGLAGFALALAGPSILMAERLHLWEWFGDRPMRWIVLNRMTIDPFIIKVVESSDPEALNWRRECRISRDGRILHTIPGEHFRIIDNVDVTGKGQPEIIIWVHPGGNGANDTFHVFEVDAAGQRTDLVALAVLPLCGEFVDLDGDGVAEFVGLDIRTYVTLQPSATGGGRGGRVPVVA